MTYNKSIEELAKESIESIVKDMQELDKQNPQNLGGNLGGNLAPDTAKNTTQNFTQNSGVNFTQNTGANSASNFGQNATQNHLANEPRSQAKTAIGKKIDEDLSELIAKVKMVKKLQEERLSENAEQKSKSEDGLNDFSQLQSEKVQSKIDLDELKRLSPEQIKAAMQIQASDTTSVKITKIDYEKRFLERVKERILVLFCALQAEQNEQDLANRLALTIEFIQYLLAQIESRLDEKSMQNE